MSGPSMFYKDLFGLLSLVVSIVGYAPYFVTILNGKTKPHMFSWIIWTMAIGLAFVAQVSRQAGPGAWVTGCAVLACLAIAVLAVRYGEKDITRSDEIVFGLALAAIPLWVATKEPLWSVLLMALINDFGFYPTFRKTLKDPHGENAPFFVSVVVKYLLGIAAIEHYSLVTVLFPLNCAVVNAAFLGLLFWRRRQLSRAGALPYPGATLVAAGTATAYSALPQNDFLAPPLPKPFSHHFGGRGIFSALRT